MAEAEPAPAVTPAAITATPEWESLERDPDFQALVKTKRSFIVPATIFFLVYYFGFLVIVGYLPDIANVS